MNITMFTESSDVPHMCTEISNSQFRDTPSFLAHERIQCYNTEQLT